MPIASTALLRGRGRGAAIEPAVSSCGLFTFKGVVQVHDVSPFRPLSGTIAPCDQYRPNQMYAPGLPLAAHLPVEAAIRCPPGMLRAQYS